MQQPAKDVGSDACLTQMYSKYSKPDRAPLPNMNSGINLEIPHNFLQKYPLGQPLTALDGADMRSLFRAAYDWLAEHYEIVNRLNVFPVPDGDTGTNMLLTVKSAWAAILAQGGQTAGGVVAAAAEGAHHGSRGNSGVILGQLLQGFSQALAQKVSLSVQDLVEGWHRAVEVAYKSVPIPIEGTILTVAREISVAAKAAEKTE